MKMNSPFIVINGKRWIDCPEPVSYAASDRATNQGHTPGSGEWWRSYREFRRLHYLAQESRNAD
jgi:hypothetical protein